MFEISIFQDNTIVGPTAFYLTSFVVADRGQKHQEITPQVTRCLMKSFNVRSERMRNCTQSWDRLDKKQIIKSCWSVSEVSNRQSDSQEENKLLVNFRLQNCDWKTQKKIFNVYTTGNLVCHSNVRVSSHMLAHASEAKFYLE